MSQWQQFSVAGLIADGKLIIGDGYRAKNDELTTHGLPFARAGNINCGFQFADADHFPIENVSRIGNKVSEPGDVVFTSKGTVGRFALVREDTQRFVYSPQLCFWRSVDGKLIEPRFLYFWMYGREFFLQYKGVAGQTDMAEYVSLGDQRRMHITLPEIGEQRAIASILGALDDKIELNRRMNETLEALAQTLFKSWFVDATQSALPKGWREATLGEVAENASNTFDFSQVSDVVFVNTGDVLCGDFLHSNRSSKIGLPGQAKKAIRKDDILFSEIRPGNRRYAYVDFDPVGYVVSTKFMVIRASEKIEPRILYQFLTSAEALQEFQIEAESRSGTFPQITFDSISRFKIILPPIEFQRKFVSQVALLDKRIKANKEESRTLAALRDALLPKLLSGELRVPAAAKLVEARA